MRLKIVLEIAEVFLSILLMALILLQSKGVGLSATFGGAGFATSKRGVEKVVFYFTITLIILVSFTSLLLTLKN